MEAGAIAPLVELVRRGSEGAQENAAAALMNLSINDANAVAEAGAIAPLVELLRSGSDDAKEDAVGALRYLANNDATAAAIAAAGAIASFEQLARDGKGDAQRWASEALERVRAARSERWKAERERAGVDDLMPERPKPHVCPITHEAMIDPVIDALGNTYGRVAIERWLRGHSTSPLTGAELPHKEVGPNKVLKSIIQEWEEEKHKECMAAAAAQAG